jgi:hypothetical protein
MVLDEKTVTSQYIHIYNDYHCVASMNVVGIKQSGHDKNSEIIYLFN